MSIKRERRIKRDNRGRRTDGVSKREITEMKRLYLKEKLTAPEIGRRMKRDPRTVKKHLGIGEDAPSLLGGEEWPHGELSAEKGTILRGKDAGRWATSAPQQIGEDFFLDFGKERKVRNVRFLQGLAHQWDYPKRWRMILQGDAKIVKEVEGTGPVGIKLEEPLQIRYLSVVILEPRLPNDHPPATCWAADNIEVS